MSKTSIISPTAELGANVNIGRYCVIHDNVVIHDNSIIGDYSIIGEPTNQANAESTKPKTIIGAGSIVRSHSIIYHGCSIGRSLSTGHRVTIRENTIIGQNCSVGTLCDLQGDLSIGDYVRLHSNVHIGKKSTLENFVFIYPYVVLTNDPTPPSNLCIGPTVKAYAQICTMSVILPGISIGEHALIGAGSIVTKDIGDYMLAVGNPAKTIKDTRDIRSREDNSSHYPWPFRFSRNMPWEKTGYDNWLTSNSQDL